MGWPPLGDSRLAAIPSDAGPGENTTAQHTTVYRRGHPARGRKRVAREFPNSRPDGRIKAGRAASRGELLGIRVLNLQERSILSTPNIPSVPLHSLDQLWFQVAGTVCNLRCSHCFISCSPDNHSFWFMTREEVRSAVEESLPYEVKEYYFTGGEPFMNREMTGILDDTLRHGPATVLTNATLLPDREVRALEVSAAKRPHPLTFRVSLDGPTARANDRIRGEGSYDRAMEGVARLVRAGFQPIITTMQSWTDCESKSVLARFREKMAGIGYPDPALKVLPPLRIGEEEKRDRGYLPCERVTQEMLEGYDDRQLLCAGARLVTAKGVYACPILLDYPSARLGDTLKEATAIPAPLGEAACYTCYANGAICSNATSGTNGAAPCAE